MNSTSRFNYFLSFCVMLSKFSLKSTHTHTHTSYNLIYTSIIVKELHGTTFTSQQNIINSQQALVILKNNHKDLGERLKSNTEY